MAISARTNIDPVTFPDGTESKRGDLREPTGDTAPICNTCGKECGIHMFRPTFAYRCVHCLTRFGKARTVTVNGVIRLSEDGEAHIGPVDVIPA